MHDSNLMDDSDDLNFHLEQFLNQSTDPVENNLSSIFNPNNTDPTTITSNDLTGNTFPVDPTPVFSPTPVNIPINPVTSNLELAPAIVPTTSIPIPTPYIDSFPQTQYPVYYNDAFPQTQNTLYYNESFPQTQNPTYYNESFPQTQNPTYYNDSFPQTQNPAFYNDAFPQNQNPTYYSGSFQQTHVPEIWSITPVENPPEPNWEAINAYLKGQVRPGADVERVFRCNVCGAEFANAQALGGHKGMHRKNKNIYMDGGTSSKPGQSKKPRRL